MFFPCHVLGTWQHALEHGIVGLLQANFFINFLFHNVAPVVVFSCHVQGTWQHAPEHGIVGLLQV